MTTFVDRLCSQIKTKNNPTVMGLDPKLSYIPKAILDTAIKDCDNMHEAAGLSIERFNFSLLDAVATIIPAIKPQFAYYEMYGVFGIKALINTIAYAKKKGLLVIADAKRNDIGSTAEAYANAILQKTVWLDGQEQAVMDADAVTLNAYLGQDSLAPFLSAVKNDSKGLFILVRTSNPSAADFQDLILENGKPLYEAVAQKVGIWGKPYLGTCGYSSVGAVVGATWPEQAKRLRMLMPQTFFLVPGYGAQGGTADTAAACFDQNGKGAIVNASRSLMCAYMKDKEHLDVDFQAACYNEAIRMKDDLNRALENKKNA